MHRPAVPRTIATLLVLAALALAGCGSSSPSGATPAAYVKSICTSLTGWSSGIKAAGTKLQSSAAGTTSLSTGKQQYQAFVSSLVSVTGRTVQELKAAGVPAVNNGKSISNALVNAFSQAKAGLAKAESQAAAIPTTNASSYQAAATGVTASIRQTLAQMATVRPGKDPQLHAAAAKEPACQALKSA